MAQFTKAPRQPLILHVCQFSALQGASGGLLTRILRPVNIADVMLPPS
jgi:hypothetical protein